MIARLRGNVLEIAEDGLVVDVHGVGYLVYASPRVLRELPAVGGAVDLVVETLVREDAIQLIGFTSLAEKRLFRLLQGIQGVGTRLALAILGVLDPAGFERAVVSRDKTALTRAPGVGPRLAQRIIAELEGRVGGLASGTEVAPTTAPLGETGPVAETVTALAQLGYARSEAHAAAQEAVGELGDGADLAAILRRALQILGTRLG
ncbi:MAG: Holliday junction branch migration protein RuvA [Alphaproteobacteria bacterium]|nr:Holliday junction branch migration protein RuvA [Alphaproteobacteria bacterium]